MPPKRGKKGKRRGDSSSDDDASTSAAAAAVMASLKQPAATLDGSEAENAAGAAAGKATASNKQQARGKAKGKKKGKGGRNNNNDSDSDDGDALDPLAHLRGGRGRGGGKPGGLDSEDEEDRPKKPLTKKEKRRLEEEQRRREKEVRAPRKLGGVERCAAALFGAATAGAAVSSVLSVINGLNFTASSDVGPRAFGTSLDSGLLRNRLGASASVRAPCLLYRDNEILGLKSCYCNNLCWPQCLL